MPCKSLVLSGGTVVLEHWTGVVTHEELLAHNRQLLLDPTIARGAAVLADCRSARIEVPQERLHELAELHGDPARPSSISRFAFLVPPHAYSRAESFAREIGRFGITVIVFSSLPVACQWLGIDPNDVPWE